MHPGGWSQANLLIHTAAYRQVIDHHAAQLALPVNDEQTSGVAKKGKTGRKEVGSQVTASY